MSADYRPQLLFRFLGRRTIEHVGVLVGDSLELLTDAQVVEGMRAELRVQHEAEVRLIGLVDQVAGRGLAQVHGCKSAVQFLRQLLKVSAGEAAAKLRLAAAISPRRTLTGELLPPAHPDTAAAFTAGVVSSRAADIVTRTVDQLPDCVLEEAHPAVEQVLLDLATEHDPQTLAGRAGQTDRDRPRPGRRVTRCGLGGPAAHRRPDPLRRR
ncbi:MAG TPA: DUF222 domain-containing protein [Jatrophihabitans sp.]